MKRITIILLFILFSIVLFAQGDTIPSSGFETIQSPFWKIYTLDEDSTIWMYGGNKYGWTQLVPFRKYKKLLDSAQVKSDTLTWDATKYDLDTLEQKTLDSLLLHWNYIKSLETNLPDWATSIEAQTGVSEVVMMNPRRTAEQITLNQMPYFGAKENLYSDYNLQGDTGVFNRLKLLHNYTEGHYLRIGADNNVISEAISGALIYQGIWDATTNTPTLADGIGTNGHYYRVDAGADSVIIDLGHGDMTFFSGDDVLYNGTMWERIPNLGFTLQAATTTHLGGVIIGDNINVTVDGIISIDKQNLSFNTATGELSISEGTNANMDGRYTLISTFNDSINNHDIRLSAMEADTAHWNGDVYEFEAEQGVLTYSVPFTLQDNMIVLLNGSPLKKNQWSGNGTTNLNLQTNIYNYDLVIIKN